MAVMTKAEFIKEVARCVKKYAPQFGILVYSPIIAQACLESGYGTSKKAALYNNILGLKYRKNRVTCNNGYFEDGGSEQNADGSYTLLPSTTAWYRFDSIEKCVLGYFQFTNISNYAALKGETDPYQYLVKIKAANYATSLNYVDNVYRVITTNNLTQYDPKITAVHRVAIDAGHGSNTAGKRHPDGYREHYSNVYISYYLDQILRKNNIETLKVSWDDENAHDDTDVALTTRQAQIKAWGAEITISVHANAHGDGKSYTTGQGIETLYHITDSKAGDSLKLATCIQEQIIKGTVQKNRGVKRMALSMCNCPAMGVKAAALIEAAFMTNKTESELLKSDAYCRETAKEIAQGVFNYFGMNGNVNVPLTAIDYDDEDESTTPVTPAPSSKEIVTGECFKLKNEVFYGSSVAKTGVKKSGTFYVWSNEVVNGRVRMTNSKTRVGVKGQITGWVEEKELLDYKIDTSTTSSTIAQPTLKKGMKNDQIKVLQQNLNKVINAGLTVDGSFGAKTEDALKKFQKANGLVADGVYGTNSYNKMKAVLGNSTPVINVTTTTATLKVKAGTIKVTSAGRCTLNNVDYSPVFDPTFYANKYPDVVKVYGKTAIKLFEHFVDYGMNEGRIGCSTFNVNNYKNRYGDLRTAFKNKPLSAYYEHYCTFGSKEKRNGK